ncbi:trypsin-like peptidase domain-containing protein [Pedobacter sp. AW31-3R]|uniref:trypsin-like peptidase domain-containing protein n=1 Tax=Pedobacter sp. AW31-3R TaxID=3445781 RepID=UPI003F9F9025
MKTNCIKFFVCLLLLLPGGIKGQGINTSKLQLKVQNCIKLVRESSVCLYEFDTLANRIIGPQFSGVVVSGDGMILTAAHACEPLKVYLVTFPGGLQQIAKGLGSIQPIDAAALKIIKPGVYPFARIGRSSSLRVNQPCFSIAYPGSFPEKMAVVRFGYVADVLDAEREMVRTTCLMEPGDSGGPVFDMDGTVIGIRSSIDQSLENNYEVPIDMFRKYWSALNKPLDYVKLPKQDSIPFEPAMTNVPLVNSMMVTSEAARLKHKLDDYAVLLTNDADGSNALGTLVEFNTPDSPRPERIHVISKSSLVQNQISAIDHTGQKLSLRVIFRDERQDLVLLEMSGNFGRGLRKVHFSKSTFANVQIGKFLLSPYPAKAGEISVVGTLETNLKATFNIGYLGAGADLRQGRNRISFVQDKSPAQIAGLLEGDEILSVNGVTVSTPDMFVDEVQRNKAQDMISLVLNRNGDRMILNIKLGVRPLVTSTHVAERFEGGRSQRRDGFEHVFVHDAKLRPSACGGPLFDFEGNFMGINMARYSRTSSIALSALGVQTFIEKAILQLVN